MFEVATFCIDERTFWLVNRLIDNKKLSYRRETARQLPTWRGG